MTRKTLFVACTESHERCLAQFFSVLLEETDEAGRRDAYLYRVPDGLLLNLELVRQGYAVTAGNYAFEHLDAFLIYQRRARADKRGLWALVDDTPAPGLRAGQVIREAPAE